MKTTGYMYVNSRGVPDFAALQRMRRVGMKANHIADIADGLMAFVSVVECKHFGVAWLDPLFDAIDGLQHAWREANGLND